MKIPSRIAFGLGLFYGVAGGIGLLIEPGSEDYRESAIFGSSVAAVVLLVKLGGRLRSRLDESRAERRSPAIPRQVNLAVFREACLVSALLDRLASERYVQQKELPPDIEVTTRRVLLDRLSEQGLREELEPWLIDLLLAPDGHWTAEQMERVGTIWEYFAMLLWVSGKAPLQPLTEKPKYSYHDVRTLSSVRAPARLRFIAPWDARPARDAAGFFHFCAWSQVLIRGAVEFAKEEDRNKARATCNEMQAYLYEGDSLDAALFIPRLPTKDLLRYEKRAYHRWLALLVLVEVLGEGAPPSDLRRLLARYL